VPAANKRRQHAFHYSHLLNYAAPGCGMGPVIAHDAQSKILSIDGIDEADVQLVWDRLGIKT
jgi:metal-sulfur cluster biosynthetic enzyme